MANPSVKPTEIKNVEVESIPEVVEFLDAQDDLESFKARNKKFFEELESIIDRYNTTLEAADKAVREKGVNCGPWQQLTPQVKYDGEKLYQAVGRDDFKKLGGIVKTVTEYNIDKGIIEAAIAGGKLPPTVIEVVRKVTRKYNNIPEGQLP